MKKLSLIIFIILVSCETDFYPDLNFKEQVVVNGFFRPSNSFNINLTKSIRIDEPLNRLPVTDASVEVFYNNQPYESLVYQGNGLYSGNRIIDSEKNFTLKINHEEFGLTTSQDSIPESVQILNATLIPIEEDVNLDQVGYPCDIQFTDPVQAKNYYGVEVVVVDISNPDNSGNIGAGFAGSIFLEDTDIDTSGNSDIIIGDENNQNIGQSIIFFEDDAFATESISVRFYLSSHNIDILNGDNYEVYFILKTLSASYFNYLKSIALQNEVNEQETPTEPVQIYTNINNGLGLFGAYNFSYINAELEQ